MIVKSCSTLQERSKRKKLPPLSTPSPLKAGLPALRLIHYDRRCQTQMCVGETLLRTSLAVKKILKRGENICHPTGCATV